MAIWTPDDEYNEAELEDLKLAIGLLTGVWTQQGADPAKKEADRYPGKRYFEGDLEKEARQAIGRLLRSNKPLDSAVRYQLAELFDGLPPHLSFDAAPMKRELVFGQRRAGKPNDDIALRNLHLASDYRTLIEAGTPRKRALGQLGAKYGLKDTAVKEAIRGNPKLKPRSFKKRIGRLTF